MIIESNGAIIYRHVSPTLPPSILNNVLNIESRTSSKTFPPPQRSTTSMCILHVWSTTSEKLVSEVFEACQEIGTEKRRLDKARTMCWSILDDICTARINTTRKRKFNSSKNMGMYSIHGLLHWLCICGADEGSFFANSVDSAVRSLISATNT